MKKIIIPVLALICMVALLFNSAQYYLPADSGAVVQTLPVIMLDAGHGGVDGGAVADDGTMEKDINLAITKKMNVFLHFFGYDVLQTRETDISIHDDDSATIRQKKVSDIRNRLAMLEETNAQLLISIHQNKYSESYCKGTQVFYGGNNDGSKLLAQNVQQKVVSLVQQDNTREIKRSTKDIYLLWNATKPAVMVECGFLSNGADLEKLKTDAYQCTMAFAIVCGLNQYQTGGEREVGEE